MQKEEDGDLENPLIHETSMYLEMCAQSRALMPQLAARVAPGRGKGDRLPLISIRICHPTYWLIMCTAEESFAFERVAQAMHPFVDCVKVDREQHPDVDVVALCAGTDG